MRALCLLLLLLFVACSPPSPSSPHLTSALALRSGTTLWLAISSEKTVPTAGLARAFTLSTTISPSLPDIPSSSSFSLPAPIGLQVYVISPGTYPALFLLTMSSPDNAAFLLARLDSPTATPVLLATTTLLSARTLVAPISVLDLPTQTPVVASPNLFLDFPPPAQDAQGYTPAPAPDSLPLAYISYATHYADPSSFVYDDTIIQELLWYDNSNPAAGIITSGTLVPDLALANYAFATTTGTLRLFALDQTLSARPANGSCLTKSTNRFGIPPGSYSAIDIHLVALVVASEHSSDPTRVLIVATHPLSAIATPCTQG